MKYCSSLCSSKIVACEKFSCDEVSNNSFLVKSYIFLSAKNVLPGRGLKSFRMGGCPKRSRTKLFYTSGYKLQLKIVLVKYLKWMLHHPFENVVERLTYF